jgi:hypothetical protein
MIFSHNLARAPHDLRSPGARAHLQQPEHQARAEDGHLFGDPPTDAHAWLSLCGKFRNFDRMRRGPMGTSRLAVLLDWNLIRLYFARVVKRLRIL